MQTTPSLACRRCLKCLNAGHHQCHGCCTQSHRQYWSTAPQGSAVCRPKTAAQRHPTARLCCARNVSKCLRGFQKLNSNHQMRHNAPQAHRQCASFASYVQNHQSRPCTHAKHLDPRDQMACVPDHATTQSLQLNLRSSVNCVPKHGKSAPPPCCGSSACETNRLHGSQTLGFCIPIGEKPLHAQCGHDHAHMDCARDQ